MLLCVSCILQWPSDSSIDRGHWRTNRRLPISDPRYIENQIRYSLCVISSKSLEHDQDDMTSRTSQKESHDQQFPEISAIRFALRSLKLLSPNLSDLRLFGSYY